MTTGHNGWRITKSLETISMRSSRSSWAWRDSPNERSPFKLSYLNGKNPLSHTRNRSKSMSKLTRERSQRGTCNTSPWRCLGCPLSRRVSIPISARYREWRQARRHRTPTSTNLKSNWTKSRRISSRRSQMWPHLGSKFTLAKPRILTKRVWLQEKAHNVEPMPIWCASSK